MAFYPKHVRELLVAAGSRAPAKDSSGRGTGASFLCGCAVTFYVTIDTPSGKVERLTFKSNGCGYMIAAAQSLASSFQYESLSELHGLGETDLMRQVSSSLGALPEDRVECASVAIQAIRSAFADYRNNRIEEFRGERALVCTCFGVSEETIEHLVTERAARTVEDVTTACRAGGGCGSCLMIIREILDEHLREI